MKELCKRGHTRTPENLTKAGACKQCNKLLSPKRQKDWVKKNPKRRREIVNRYRKNARIRNPEQFKNYDLRKHYGITLETQQQLAKKQKFRCAICRKKTKLVTDHEHNGTKNVRGLLCSKCNLLLGNANESIVILICAAIYLHQRGVNGRR